MPAADPFCNSNEDKAISLLPRISRSTGHFDDDNLSRRGTALEELSSTAPANSFLQESPRTDYGEEERYLSVPDCSVLAQQRPGLLLPQE